MLRIIIFTLLLSLSFNGFAKEHEDIKEIKVEYRQFRYKLKYSNDFLELSGEGIDIGFKAKSCNQDFIQETNNRIKNQMNYPFLPVLPKNGLRITQGTKVFFEESETKRGIFFIGLPSLFKQLVIEEQLLCKK